MEQEELTVVDEILQNYNVSVIKDTKSIKEIKVLNNNRSSTRDAIENALYAAKIPFGALTRDVGSFGGTEFNFDQKKVRFIYKPKTGGGGSGAGAADTERNESAQAVYAAIAFGMGKTINNNDITIDELAKFVKGPDFPTGGLIMGRAGLTSAFTTGRGSIRIRARAEIVEDGRNTQIVVTEIPYQQSIENIEQKIADAVDRKILDGIRELRNESAKGQTRFVIELKRDAPASVVLNNCLLYTSPSPRDGLLSRMPSSA